MYLHSVVTVNSFECHTHIDERKLRLARTGPKCFTMQSEAVRSSQKQSEAVKSSQKQSELTTCQSHQHCATTVHTKSFLTHHIIHEMSI